MERFDSDEGLPSTTRKYFFAVGLRSDVGRKRSENQDSYAYLQSENISLFIVADGMGGSRGGATASALTVNAVTKYALNASGQLTESSLRTAIEKSNEKVFLLSNEDKRLAGMGTTIVALAFVGDRAIVAHVGDSRIYKIADGKLHQLTRDHSLIQDLLDSGTISEAEAENHPIAHMLTRSLGPTETVDVEVRMLAEPVQRGDRFLLCSDGLLNHVKDDEIQELILSNSVDKAAEALLQLALERGGTDNITLTLVETNTDINAPSVVMPPQGAAVDIIVSRDFAVEDAEQEEDAPVTDALEDATFLKTASPFDSIIFGASPTDKQQREHEARVRQDRESSFDTGSAAVSAKKGETPSVEKVVEADLGFGSEVDESVAPALPTNSPLRTGLVLGGLFLCAVLVVLVGSLSYDYMSRTSGESKLEVATTIPQKIGYDPSATNQAKSSSQTEPTVEPTPVPSISDNEVTSEDAWPTLKPQLDTSEDREDNAADAIAAKTSPDLVAAVVQEPGKTSGSEHEQEAVTITMKGDIQVESENPAEVAPERRTDVEPMDEKLAGELLTLITPPMSELVHVELQKRNQVTGNRVPINWAGEERGLAELKAQFAKEIAKSSAMVPGEDKIEGTARRKHLLREDLNDLAQKAYLSVISEGSFDAEDQKLQAKTNEVRVQLQQEEARESMARVALDKWKKINGALTERTLLELAGDLAETDSTFAAMYKNYNEALSGYFAADKAWQQNENNDALAAEAAAKNKQLRSAHRDLERTATDSVRRLHEEANETLKDAAVKRFYLQATLDRTNRALGMLQGMKVLSSKQRRDILERIVAEYDVKKDELDRLRLILSDREEINYRKTRALD